MTDDASPQRMIALAIANAEEDLLDLHAALRLACSEEEARRELAQARSDFGLKTVFEVEREG